MKKIKNKVKRDAGRYLRVLINDNVSKTRIKVDCIFVNCYKKENKLIVHYIKHRKNIYKK